MEGVPAVLVGYGCKDAGMFVSNITDTGSMPGIVSTLTFNEAKLRMIAENIANNHTVGYRAKQLDRQGFQQALRQSFDERKRRPNAAFVVEAGRQVRTGEGGGLTITPELKPVENILSHDGTNISIEREMADLAETNMSQELMTTLLRGKFDGLRKAIRGQA